MGKLRRIVALVDDYPSIVSPDLQAVGIREAYKNAPPSAIDFVMLRFDKIADPHQLLKVLQNKKATHLVCFRLISIRSFTSNFWEMCHFISNLKAGGIEFISITEGISTEDEVGTFLEAITSGWKSARLSYKSENAKISHMKAKEKGIPLGRPKRRDDSKIAGLREQGLSIRDIAAKTGVSTAAVQRALKSRDETI